jgi:aromatic-L-amino-acid/L-tryptophan decarboxylase
MGIPLEPSAEQRSELNNRTLQFIEEWTASIPEMDARGPDLSQDQITGLHTPPGEEGEPFSSIIDNLKLAGQPGILHPSGGHLSYIPNAGLHSGALADLMATVLNRYTGVAGAAPGMTAIETGITDWIASLFDLGEHSASILLSGGSTANMTGIVAARVNRLGERFADGTLYVTTHTHHSVAKAARIAGFRDDQIRRVEVDENLRMSPESLTKTIAADRAEGLRPFLVVASAGTTDTGTVDHLDEIAAVAEAEGLWMHTDGAYGAFFELTDRGKQTLQGIGQSDSIALDPHKGLSIPFGVGALAVRDKTHLLQANQGRGAYLDHEDTYQGMRDISSLGPELTRPFRGLSVWLPLHLHGVAAFRDALDMSLDLAANAYQRVQSIRGVRAPWSPDLSVVAFGFDDDDLGRQALAAVNADRRTHLSSTLVEDRFVLRLAILNRRTTADHIEHALDIVEKTLIG